MTKDIIELIIRVLSLFFHCHPYLVFLSLLLFWFQTTLFISGAKGRFSHPTSVQHPKMTFSLGVLSVPYISQIYVCQILIALSLNHSQSVQLLSCVRLFSTHGLQHTRLSCPSLSPRVYPSSCPLNWWCHPTISSYVTPFSSHLQSCQASGSFPISQFFVSGGQSIRVSASASVLMMNIQDWSPLEWTGWVSLQYTGLSRVFSNTTVQKHQFFLTWTSLWSNSTSMHDY